MGESREKNRPTGKGGDKKGQAQTAKTGTYIFKDGSRYEGEYKDDGGLLMRHGQGKYIDSTSNSVYTGSWDADKMAGKGKLELSNGDSYEGHWRDNQFQGSGTYVWADGSSFTGDWDESVLNGPGKYVGSEGQNWQGSVYKNIPTTLLPELAQ